MASFYENISGYTPTNTDTAYFTDIDVSGSITVAGDIIDLDALTNLVDTPVFSGVISSQGLDLADDKYIRIGTGNDLEIYHDGANSLIKNVGDGDLNIQGQDVAIQSLNGDNIFFSNGEAAFLDWRGSSGAGTKLTTTATGIDVNGTVTADGVALGNNERITLGGESSGKLEIYEATGGNGVIEQTGSGSLVLKGQNTDITNDANALMIRAGLNEAALYHRNGDNEGKKLQTTNLGITVTGIVDCDGLKMDDGEYAQFGTSNDLKIWHSGANSYIQDSGTGQLVLNTTNGGGIYIESAGETMAQFVSNGTVNLYHDNAHKFATTATGIDVTGTVKGLNFQHDNNDVTDQSWSSFARNGGSNALYVQQGATDKAIASFRKGSTQAAQGTEVLGVSQNGINVTGTVTCDEALTISSTGADTDAKPDIWLFNNAPAAVNERLGQITWFGKNNASPEQETVNYAFQEVKTTNVGDGTEQAEMQFHVRYGANHVEVLTLDPSGIDVDGTVEADAFSGTGSVYVTDFIDDDSFASASATNVPTAESVKAYVDANAGGGGGGGGGETLAQTLALGASTGGTDLSVYAGDDIVFSDTSKAIFKDADGDPKLEIYSDGLSSNDSVIKSTNRNLYIESSGLTTSAIHFNAYSSHRFYTNFSSSATQFSINESTGVRANGSFIQSAYATSGMGGSISARTAISSADQVTPVIDFYRPINTSNNDVVGSLKYFGANASGYKSYYGEMLCTAVDTSSGGNQKGQFSWYIADGAGQTVPVTDVNADNTGKKLAMVVDDTFTGFYGGNQLFLSGVNSQSEKGYLNFQNSQSLRPPLTGDSSKIYLPQTSGDKVMSVGGVGSADSYYFGTTMSATDLLKYRGQHLVRYGVSPTATTTLDLPRVQGAGSGSSHSTTLGNIGDIYTISSVNGGALTIDRDASGTAQTLYELNGSALVPFTNNPTIAAGGSITLQAVGTNTYLIMNAKGLTDA